MGRDLQICVVGRTGQLARSLTEVAAQCQGLQLETAGRPQLDLARPGSAAAFIKRAAPDLVINAAAYTAVDQAEDESERAFRINGEAAGEIAYAARAAGAPIIHVSTDYVFDGRDPLPYQESARTEPLSVYGRSKLAGEQAVREATSDHLIVRTAWVYSPFGRNFVTAILDAARGRECLTVVEDQRGSPTSALELASGLVAVARAVREGTGLGETYHLAAAGAVSRFDFACEILRVGREFGLPSAEVEPVRTDERPEKAVRPQNSVLDSRKFAKVFGFAMRPWQAGVAEVVERLSKQQRGQ